MIKSMTGFGSASVVRNGHKAIVEVSCVNSKKGLDLRITCPREISSLVETSLRPKIQKLLARGTLSILIKYELNSECQQHRLVINEEVLLGIWRQMNDLNLRNGVTKEIDMVDLLRLPGVISESQEVPTEELLPLIFEAFDKAFEQFDLMRSKEGKILGDGLLDILSKMESVREQIISTLADSLKAHHQRLRDRIRLLGVDCSIDDERLLKEIAFCAEKMDIEEELLRLESHFRQFRDFITSSEPQGRSLEFLCQEIGREINTLGAKVGSSEHARAAIVFRNELDRLTEQVRNVE